MGRETEIKLRVRDLGALRKALKRMGARPIAGKIRVHEWNELFDTGRDDLKRRGEMLRIRTETMVRHDQTFLTSARQPPHPYKTKGAAPDLRSRANPGGQAILAFKQPIKGHKRRGGRERHKVRKEVELVVEDGRALAKIFEGLGMRVWFRYEKYRTTFYLPESKRWARDLLIEVDETPIGVFVELEGPGRAIDRMAKVLGYSKEEYITENYFVLYREHCRANGLRVGDMVFAT